MSDVIELKREYNKIIKRVLKGHEFLSNKPVTNELERQLKGYKQLLDKGNELLEQIGDFTDDEVLGGFNVD